MFNQCDDDDFDQEDTQGYFLPNADADKKIEAWLNDAEKQAEFKAGIAAMYENCRVGIY